ncbi:MAG: hypothetical protein QOJ24_3970 [Mycobacterium sp.]|nr:hypothetical protein [Mycobacterium sp.]
MWCPTARSGDRTIGGRWNSSDTSSHSADPDPVTVLHTARQRGPADRQSHRRVTAWRHHRFAVHLADLYAQTVAPASAGQYAREVLEDAFRRAAGCHGTRLTQLAESGADREELANEVARMRTELAGLWRRGQAARRSHHIGDAELAVSRVGSDATMRHSAT